MTLKEFKTRSNRKTIDELQSQNRELTALLNIALQYYMSNPYPANPSDDFKYMKQIGRKIQITQKIIERKLKAEE